MISPQPAVKLVYFFGQMSTSDLKIRSDGQLDAEVGGLPRFSTCKTQDISKAMRELEALIPEDIERWVKYWDATGLFDGI